MIRRPPVVASILLLSITCGGYARERRPTKKVQRATDAAALDAAKQRRETAVLLLVTLADDASKFSDTALRARTQTRVADQLWDVERDRSRELFERAWDSSTLAKEDGDRRAEEQRREPQEAGEPNFVRNECDPPLDVIEAVANAILAVARKVLDEKAAEPN